MSSAHKLSAYRCVVPGFAHKAKDDLYSFPMGSYSLSGERKLQGNYASYPFCDFWLEVSIVLKSSSSSLTPHS